MVLAGVDFWYDNYGQAKPRPKTLHLKFRIQGFYNTIMTLIFIYEATDIKWLPFCVFFSRTLLRLASDNVDNVLTKDIF